MATRADSKQARAVRHHNNAAPLEIKYALTAFRSACIVAPASQLAAAMFLFFWPKILGLPVFFFLARLWRRYSRFVIVLRGREERSADNVREGLHCKTKGVVETCI
jgi:hypothetical protein